MKRFQIHQIVLILIIGMGIGGLTPWFLQTLPISGAAGEKQALSAAQDSNTQTASQISSSANNYYCKIEQGILSVFQGVPIQNGSRILTGLDVSKWPPEMLTMAEQIEFHSLDEVQSFIDSMSEELWLE